MLRFACNFLIWMLPIVLVMIFPFVITIQSKERFYNIDAIISDVNQGKQSALVGYAYLDDVNRYYKTSILRKSEKRTVWALGSSRVLQFRENMFSSPFYNAGSMVQSAGDFLQVLQVVEEDRLPGYLLVSIDHWMFNSRWKHHDEVYDKKSFLQNQTTFTDENVKVWVKGVPRMYKDLVKGKLKKQREVIAEDFDIFVGMNAFFRGSGFRNDGSYYYGRRIHAYLAEDSLDWENTFSVTLGRIAKGSDRFSRMGDMSADALAEMEKFLNACAEAGIAVVGFMPPFPSTVCKALEKTGDLADIISLYQELEPIFKGYGFEVYNYSCSDVASSNHEAIDGFHGGERAYLRLLTDMVDRGSVLHEVTDSKQLHRDLLQGENRYEVY